MEYQLVRYKTADKKTLEVLCNKKTVLKFREGDLSLEKTVYSKDIFTNSTLGEKVADQDLTSEFGEISRDEILDKILKEGEYQMSTEERKEFMEIVKAKVLHYIHNNYIDPTMKKPHPLTRIEQAYKQLGSKFHLDLHHPVEAQAKKLVSLMVEIIPMKYSCVEACLKLSHEHLGKCSGIVQKNAKILGEKYTKDGVEYGLQIIPGDFDTFVSQLNNITKGHYQLEIEGAQATEAPEKGTKQGKQRKGKKRR